MIFMSFAVAIAAVFFVGSLILLRLGQYLGLRYRKRNGTEGTGGLATVEAAIFGLMGLLLAFTIAGALQRFDDRRQLVIQEATAATTAYDRLALFGGDDGSSLQSSLKEYVHARVDLYRIALYVVTDMEYPRLGLIRIEAFDHFLKDTYDQMR